jgi:uncharacterized protein involved in outer membrane biogenesis
LAPALKDRIASLWRRIADAARGRDVAPREPNARRDFFRRAARRGLAAAGLLLALVVAFLVFFDWNWLRGPVGRIASAQLNRTVVIAGDLDVHPWSWAPTIEAHDLRIGHPRDLPLPDGAAARMADIGLLRIQIEIPQLLRGRTVLRLIEASDSQVHLVRAADERNNWTFGSGRKGEAGRLPAIRRLVIDRADLRIDDARRGARFVGRVSTRDSTTGEGAGRFLLLGDGSLNGARFSARLSGSPLLNISPDRPYRFEGTLRAGDTRIRADGHIDRPFDLNRLGARFAISGSDLNDLYLLTGLALPNTGPYSVSAGFVRDGARYHLNNLAGRIGDSDISGRLTVETGRERPLLLADLRSRRLDFDDLGSLFGMAPATGPGETASAEQKAMARSRPRLLPTGTLQVERIRSMDAEVRYRAETVNAPNLPLRRVSVDAELKAGVLTLNPIAFTLDRGTISGRASLDASKDVPRTEVDLRLSDARLENWITVKVDGAPVIEGGLVGRIRLTGTGDSVAKAASSANGTLTLVAPQGEVRQAFAELMGVNISKGLILLLSEDPKKTSLRCAVADFQVTNGVARARRIVADTGVVLIEGQGTINLRTETINLRIEGDSKKPRLLRVFAPITVSGPILSPKAGVETGGLLGQGGAAAVLGAVVSPLTAILPFVDPGLAEDANCAALIGETRRRGAPAARTTAAVK